MPSASFTSDVIVVGAGISGIVTAKCLRDAGFSVVVLERTGDVGGLWTYRDDEYGVMSFTHINVSKHNYCFSDYPFPDDVVDFPYHKDMADYVKSYTQYFDIDKVIKFHRDVTSLRRNEEEDKWVVNAAQVTSSKEDKAKEPEQSEVYEAKFVAVCSGHHVKPSWPNFIGLDTFPGIQMHAVQFKDVIKNGLTDKRVVIVGIGNSAVDAVVNCATYCQKKPVHLSTRSGAWVVPNYIFGHPTDYYACRLFLQLPWQISTFILEKVITLLHGSPFKWSLNPKMHALQTQPTVSPTLIHHIQRGQVKVVNNIQRIEGKKIYFKDGEMTEADCLVFCTGYKIDLPFLPNEIKEGVLKGGSNDIQLYKNVFAPSVGKSLAFIGFVQPASGGILTMSEIQARWFAELCKGTVFLPSKTDMEEDIQKEMAYVKKRWYHSARHTIQKDPILYNDEIASFIGAKPELLKHPTIAWRLLLGSCGAAQWRLQGPHSWPGAKEAVCRVPVTELMLYTAIALLLLLFIFLWRMVACCYEWMYE